VEFHLNKYHKGKLTKYGLACQLYRAMLHEIDTRMSQNQETTSTAHPDAMGYEKCRTCGGTGLIQSKFDTFGKTPCSKCFGTGIQKCRTCGGTGHLRIHPGISGVVICPKCFGTGIQKEG